ncbi:MULTISPECIES: hypothetical protein [Idiomarina]|uniref:hypothetical protein n=1 Tax=Idiomarina TaxID=135575 RepID=UPI00241CC698|nr:MULTISPECIES: hypothetical protein [Idiomarina]
MAMNQILMLVVTSLAAIAAVISGVVAWRQHIWNKRNHLASVRPFITGMFQTYGEPFNVSYRLHNKGLGPALIKVFNLEWERRPILMDTLRNQLFERLGEGFKVYGGHFQDDFALAKDDTFVILELAFVGEGNLDMGQREIADAVVKDLLRHCRLTVKYHSFLSDDEMEFKTRVAPELLKAYGVEVKD